VRQYTIHNADSTAPQDVIEDPAQEGWTLLADGPKPEETTRATADQGLTRLVQEVVLDERF
jgi:hypothetical protein